MRRKNIMKKFIRAIVLVMACVLVFATLASCGKSIDGITKKAEKEGYEVEESNEQALSMMNLALVAMGIDGEIEAAVEIAKETDDDFLFAEIYQFNKASAAKAFVEKYTTIEGELGEDEVIEQSGKCVIVGDKATVEAVW